MKHLVYLNVGILYGRGLCQFCIDYLEKENEKASIQPDNSGSVAVD